MKWYREKTLKNEMITANFLANLMGVVFVQGFMLRSDAPLPDSIWENPVIDFFDSAFTPAAFLFVVLATLIYERPIRRYLDALFAQEPISAELAAVARRRLLNEPFVLIALDFGMWLLAAIVYPVAFWMVDAGPGAIQRSLAHSLSTGIITVTAAFFMLEHLLQKRLAPHVFPDGRLSSVPKSLRIRIRTRLAALLLACNLIPLLSIMDLLYRTNVTVEDPSLALGHIRHAIYTHGVIFILTGVFLTGLVARNLTSPFREIIRALRDIRNGIFDKKVRVTTNDEIGYTGDVINEMTEGLMERERMRQALDLAMEVQQNLLPKTAPRIDGLDIAGACIYCEETGGDYFDYMEPAGSRDGTFSVAVGDVSDHGLPSALLMTTARAFLRQRVAVGGDLAQIVGDVNRQLCRDVEDTGRFVTLFLAAIDRPGLRLRWVNAGHEPAAVYDPATDAYTELGRTGLPLGVAPESTYQDLELGMAPGQIIVIGTDGIWESQNSRSEMFGKKRFQDVLRMNSRSSPREILAAVVDAVESFCRPVPRTDDITLVVIKIEA